MRSGSGTGEFTRDDFLAFHLGKIGIATPGGGKAGVPSHKPKPLRHGPLFSKAHFPETLELNGVQWIESQGSEKVVFATLLLFSTKSTASVLLEL